jgi:hypothetical protein
MRPAARRAAAEGHPERGSLCHGVWVRRVPPRA